MVPINQVILGGDPLLGSSIVSNNLEEQLQLLEKYKQNLEAARQMKQQQQYIQQSPQKSIWDDINSEVNPMTEEQKVKMFQDEDYAETYNKIQVMVQAEILNMVKGRIEASAEGKELLQKQLRIVKRLKERVIKETNEEMELFRKFKEFSKEHPGITYEDFIKEKL